jgi:hypothetical protein
VFKFDILEPLSFEGSFHLRKEKDAIKVTGIVFTILDEVLVRCESPLLLHGSESVWDELYANPLPQIFKEDLTNSLLIDV